MCTQMSRSIFLLQILFTIYLFMRERERERGSVSAWAGGVEGGREAGFMLSAEPDRGLDPKTLRSCPEPKADAQPLSHPGAPTFFFEDIVF